MAKAQRYKFCFGPWNISEGQDPYGPPTRPPQTFDWKLDALKKRGVVRIFTDKQTGTRFDRQQFLAALDYVNEGDTLVVWKLDRLGRSLKQLIETVTELQGRGIELKSLTENIDTTTSAGKLISITAAVYQMKIINRYDWKCLRNQHFLDFGKTL